MKTNPNTLVLKAVKVLCDHADADEEELVHHLIEAGANRIEAEKLVVFVPLAFGRAVLQRLGARNLSSTFMVVTATGQILDRRFSAEPLYCSAVALADGKFREGFLTREEFQAVAGRSSELDAAAQVTSEDIKTCFFSPPVLGRLKAEDFAPQEPNTLLGKLIAWLDG